ncbi:MAG: hypothetical protein KF836_05355 [Fimbriimonadaceae bacterium]|nr:hypothetical protein [Fimbriimonadaceae bacterium]
MTFGSLAILVTARHLTIAINTPFEGKSVLIALVHKKRGNISADDNTWQGEIVWQGNTIQPSSDGRKFFDFAQLTRQLRCGKF